MRGIPEVPDFKEIKTNRSIGARSIPKVQRSSYLELYMLKRDKDRLEKEISALEKRRKTAITQLNGINNRIEKLQKETQEEQKNKTCRDTLTKSPKKITVNY